MLRECVILVLVCVFGVGSISGRGFFCRDPETGKLHPVNSTWTASSFCGKYHCKLKRKNLTSSKYAPQRKINITTIQLLGDNLTILDIQKQDVRKDGTNVINTGKTTKLGNTNNDTVKKMQANKLIDDIDDKNASDKDRYLSAKEIKSLTEILHTVKKGDLDALIEIYNLAQDLYKELNKTSTDNVLQETMSTTKTLGKEIIKADMFKKVPKHDHTSYWYEPIANGKIKVTDLVRTDVLRTDINPEIPAIAVAMLPAASVINVAPKPAKSTIIPPMYYPLPAMGKLSDTFFSGALTHKDFRKLHYYYPMSSFQRQSSYKHKLKKTFTTPALKTTPAPTTAPFTAPTTVRNSAYNTIMNKLSYASAKYQKEYRPSLFLPYPFANIQHYNWSFPQNLYHEKPIDKLDVRKKDDTKYNEVTIKRRVDKQDNAVLMNPDLENFQDLQIRASMRKENVANTNIKQKSVRRLVERRKPDWQTDSLPQQILDEIRAHIHEKQRLFINPVSLRKKVKLERVSKLLHMDEIIRTKRFSKATTPDELEPLKSELYEVYIERTTLIKWARVVDYGPLPIEERRPVFQKWEHYKLLMIMMRCNADYSIPGYFRFGNLSQPYPECCPQRIPGR